MDCWEAFKEWVVEIDDHYEICKCGLERLIQEIEGRHSQEGRVCPEVGVCNGCSSYIICPECKGNCETYSQGYHTCRTCDGEGKIPKPKESE